MSQENSYQRDRLLEEFSKRLQQAIDESSFASLEQGVLSAQIGVSRQALRKWLEGKALPSQTRLPAIADLLKVQLTWLATGEGSMRELKGKVGDTPYDRLQHLHFSLSKEEAELLETYRQLSVNTKASFFDFLRQIAKDIKKPVHR